MLYRNCRRGGDIIQHYLTLGFGDKNLNQCVGVGVAVAVGELS